MSIDPSGGQVISAGSMEELMQKLNSMMGGARAAAPDHVAGILSTEVQGSFDFAEKVNELQSQIDSADALDGEEREEAFGLEARLAACERLHQAMHGREPAIEDGVNFNDIELIVSSLKRWYEEAYELRTLGDSDRVAKNESILIGNSEGLIHVMDELIYLTFEQHPAQIVGSIVPTVNAFKRANGVTPIDASNVEAAKELCQDMLDVNLDYLQMKEAMLYLLTEKGFEEFVESLERMSGSVKATEALVEGFRKDEAARKVVELDGVDFSKFRNLKDLVELVSPTVEKLKLSNCSITDESAHSLCHLLSQAPNLTELDLSNNEIGSQTAIHIVAAIEELGEDCKLTTLNLRDNDIMIDVLKALLDLIEEGNAGALQNVDVRHNYMLPQSMQDLFFVMQLDGRLEELTIENFAYHPQKDPPGDAGDDDDE